MENSKQLANRFREVLLNGKWIANTNYQDQLLNITWRQASKKVQNLNTIASLSFHINYYIAGVLNVFEAGTLDIRDKYSFDAPELKSEEDWSNLFKDLISNSERLAKHIETLTDAQLDSTFVGEIYGTYRRNIEALIEHAYYHLGQVSLIKKMLQS